MSAVLSRTSARASAVLLALLVLVAVFADLLASDAPVLALRDGTLSVLPAVTAPNPSRHHAAEPAVPDSQPYRWALWAIVRASAETRSAAGPLSAPSSQHVLGTDAEGRDVLCRLIHGTRSMVVAASAVMLIALVVGIGLGALAGVGPRLADFVLSRSVELTSMWPSLILVAVARTAEPAPSIVTFVLIVGLLRALTIARLVRGEVLRVSRQPFVTVARALGMHPSRVLARHILPHVLGPALVSAAFAAGSVVALEAALAFVGLGLPASYPSWGAMLGQAGSGAGALVLVPPALGILLTCGSCYVLAEALEEAWDPRRRPTLHPARSA